MYIVDDQCKNGLMIACDYGQIEIIKLLLTKKFDISALTLDGSNALMFAALGGESKKCFLY